MKKLPTYLLLLPLFLSVGTLKAQTTTLDACLEAAEKNMPVLAQESSMKEKLDNSLKSYRTAYLPTITVNGQATYQSDVPAFPFTLPGVPGLDLPQFQYRGYVEVNQPIYDAGFSKAKQKVEQSQFNTDIQSLQVNAYQLKVQVSQLYYQVILLGERKDIMRQTIHLINDRLASLREAKDAGAVAQIDVYRLESEVLEQEGKLEEILTAEQGGIEVLSILTGLTLDTQSLAPPAALDLDPSLDASAHPELKLIRSRQDILRANEGMLKAQRRPRVQAFGQAGMGAPNPYNFFEKDLSTFYMAGIRATWNIWDWGNTKRSRENLGHQQSMLNDLEAQKKQGIEAHNLQLSLEKDRLAQTIERDKKLVQLKSSIAEASTQQFEQGVITSNDLVQELLALQRAQIQQRQNEIQLNYQLTLLALETGAIQ